LAGFGFAEKVLALVVVAESKYSLVLQRTRGRESRLWIKAIIDGSQLFIEITGSPRFAPPQIAKMLLVQANKARKDGTRCSHRSTKKRISDRSIQFPISSNLLNPLIQGKETAPKVGTVSVTSI